MRCQSSGFCGACRSSVPYRHIFLYAKYAIKPAAGAVCICFELCAFKVMQPTTQQIRRTQRAMHTTTERYCVMRISVVHTHKYPFLLKQYRVV